MTGSNPKEEARDSRAELLARVVASPQFRRAARLREFLLYVGEHALNRAGEALHENEVGIAVFGRQAGYDTSSDNIVRVNATELRKRLELYFAQDGAAEQTVMEMPRGAYTLEFHPRAAKPETAAPAGNLPGKSLSEGSAGVGGPHSEEPSQAHALPVRRGRLPVLLLGLVCSILLLTCMGLAWQNWRFRKSLTPWSNGQGLHALWSNFFESESDSDLVLADTSFALVEDLENRQIPLTAYLNYDYQQLNDRTDLSADRKEALMRVMSRNNGSVGDFIVASRILALDPTQKTLRLKYAREYSAEAMKTDNVILIGSRESNPWVDLYTDRLNFRLGYNMAQHRPFVENHSPRPGEKPSYDAPIELSRKEGYSVVAFLPNLNRTGSVLVLEGTDSQATRAAGEFVTSDAALEEFFKRAHLPDSGPVPSFEVLLHNLQITGTPFRSEVVAFRIGTTQ